MDILTGLISLFVFLLTAHALEDHDPSVAFMCNRPSMYRTAKGWEKDDSTDCMKDPVDILNYCRKVYPTLDVRNVVESSKKQTISKWCGFGHNKCHHEFTVRPFRCLVGSFQSDALLVPEHCLFDHIHDSKECKNYDDWNKTAQQSCQDRGMIQQSFAILQPCGIDRFNGVEFVCCPEEDDIDQFLKEEFEYYSTTSVPETSSQPSTATTTSTKAPTTRPPTTTTATVSSSTHQGAAQSAGDVYDKYLHNVAGQFLNEHEYFMKAKTELEKHHHEKVTKMMKDWAEARQHVQDIKSVDPKGAEKLNKEITARFQKTYQALEQEGMSEKKQLVALHQQRVQAGLNEKKRHAMERYMDVLTEEETDAARILKELEHYVKAEQKDRLHSINHFKHLRDTDPREAEAVREQTLNHLDLIQARIQQAVDMLNRVPKYEAKIRQQIEDYLLTFQPLDTSVTKLLSTPIEVDPKIYDDLEPVDIIQDYQDKEDVAVNTPNTPDTPSPRQPEPVEPSPAFVKKILVPVEPIRKEFYDEEVMEDEHDFVEINQPLHGDNFHDDTFHVNSYIKQEKVNPVRKFSAPTLAVAIGSVTVFIVIVVGIVVLRRRALRTPNSSHGFVEVDTAASPEEKHVANMQLNGYENPTYKYFEMNGNTA